MPENDKGNLAGLQVLLVLDVVVGRHQNVESSLIRRVYEFAVRQFFPSPRPCFFDRMSDEKAC
jgi:hypothetical protein